MSWTNSDPRWKPFLNHFEDENSSIDSYVAQKVPNGPASIWDLFSSYLAQSSYLVWNRGAIVLLRQTEHSRFVLARVPVEDLPQFIALSRFGSAGMSCCSPKR